MGCSSEYMAPTQGEIVAGYKAELDRLTHENDQLRELVIDIVEAGRPVKVAGTVTGPRTSDYTITPTFWHQITRGQVEHRKADLKRLEEIIRENIKHVLQPTEQDIWYAKLGRVLTADPNKPLAPQLGFDPDSI